MGLSKKHLCQGLANLGGGGGDGGCVGGDCIYTCLNALHIYAIMFQVWICLGFFPSNFPGHLIGPED